MSENERLRRAFIGFHLVLGLGLLWGSVHTILDADGDIHARAIGSLEAIAAAAFLVPRLMRVGAAVLFVTIALAVVLHTVRGEWRPDLLVYAAGVVLVGVHGSAYNAASLHPA